MSLTAAQLEQRLARDALPSVVLLASAEPLLLLEAADAVRSRARALGFAERSVFEVDTGFDWDDVRRDFSSLSLFSARRLIEVRLPTGKPGKEGGEVLTQFAQDPAPDIVLLIQAAQWSRAHETAWVKAIERDGWVVPMWHCCRTQDRAPSAPTTQLARTRAPLVSVSVTPSISRASSSAVSSNHVT